MRSLSEKLLEPYLLFSKLGIGAVIVLLVNDHILKAWAPMSLTPLTGKLSDFAGAIVFVGFLDFLLLTLLPISRKASALLSAALTAIVMIAVELSPLAIKMYEEYVSIVLRFLYLPEAQLTDDVTDLLALPLIWFAYGKCLALESVVKHS